MALRKEEIELINKLAGQNQRQDHRLFQKILETSSQWQVELERSDLSQILLKITSAPKNKPAKFKFAYWVAAASISLLLLFATWLVGFHQNVVIEVPIAEIRTTWLPDSSMVVLNANSSLSFSKKDWNEGYRTVSLEGVGYFNVRKGSKFQVETKQGQVTVLGTSFNVKALKERFVVECLTGKVAVKGIEDNNSIILKPGFKSELDQASKLLIPNTFDTKRGKEWLQGTFNFKNQSMDLIWEEIERQFAIEIRYDDSTPRYYTGTFSNEDMHKALLAICKPMGMDYEIDDNKKIITITK